MLAPPQNGTYLELVERSKVKVTRSTILKQQGWQIHCNC